MNVVALYPVEKFIVSLSRHDQSRVHKMLPLLEKHSPDIMYPYAKKISPKLFEICIKGKPQIRLIFAYTNTSVILLHAFVKKTQKLPRQELHVAQKRYLQYI